MISFFCAGVPKPMGSKTAFVVKGRAVVTDGKAGPAMRSWKDSIIGAALTALGDSARIMGPVAVRLEFRLARPRGHYGKKGIKASAPQFPAVKPDADKLARCALDALTVACIADDARVVDLDVRKRYALPDAPTGVLVTVEEV